MTRKTPPINVAASVHARLLKYAKEHAEDFNFVLTRSSSNPRDQAKTPAG